MNQTVASLLTKSLALFWVLVFVDKGGMFAPHLTTGHPDNHPQSPRTASRYSLSLSFWEKYILIFFTMKTNIS